MPNHIHLLLKTGLSSIATVMRRLLTGYAVAFNRRHRHHGHLFQNRYQSFLCEEQKYRLQANAISLAALIEKVAHDYKIDSESLKSATKERSVTEARRVLCYIAVGKLGYRCTDISKKMDISAVTVSKAVRLGSQLPEVGKIQKQILNN